MTHFYSTVDPIAQRALAINLDQRLYGTFAEIGAGQEVARWFFSVGGAAGTVAKTISAYDMTVSDSIYGKAVRYVSLERLREMLDHEYALLIERLHAARGDKTCFFAFANTAAAQSHSGTSDCHAWLGIRFQTVPHAPPSEVILHTRLLDPTAALQQEAIGRLGVNLCHAAFYEGYSPSALTKTLLDDIGRHRLEIDWVKFSGPAFETDGKSTVDHRLLSLDLVRLGFTPAVLFGTDGSPLLASDAIRKQSVLVERGRFAPVTRLNLEMMTAARIAFTRDVLHHTASDSTREPKTSCGTLYEVMEITLRNLRDHGVVENADFLSRVDLLSAVGKMVLISDLGPFYKLAEYLSQRSVERVGIVLGVPLLKEIMLEHHYSDLAGGILEAFGRLFTRGVTLYVQPTRDPVSGTIVTAETLSIEPHLTNLLEHLLANKHIASLDYDPSTLHTYSSELVRSLIVKGDPSWRNMVEPAVADIICNNRYFGMQSDES